jgi:lysophospholipase L1-like esterase
MEKTDMRFPIVLLSTALALCAAGPALATQWATTWAASPQAPTAAMGPLPASPTFENQTLRQVVRISGGGTKVRVRFTNEFGSAPVSIGGAHIALDAGHGGIRPGSDHVLTFGGRTTAVIRPGAPLVSDPVDMPVTALSRLTVSAYLPGKVDSCTCHGTAMETGYLVSGDQTAAAALPGAQPLQARALLSGVDVGVERPARTIVALGDSITDGVGSTPDADRRWPDLLAERLAHRGGAVTYIANEGISGNRVLSDGAGVSALARFDRDVLSTPGLAYVVVFEGINDIGLAYMPKVEGPMAETMKRMAGPPVTAEDMIAGYKQLIARAHAHGVKIYGATIAPYEGASYASPDGEKVREAVNQWIRTSKAFDAVLDFDAVLRDPAHPTRIQTAYQAGDHLHGSDAGYRAVARSIDLNLFK